jgi:cytochrome c oxidase subunit 4
MTDTSHGHDAHGAHAAHGDHGGIGKYLLVFLALCVLTLCSFLTYTDLWRSHLPIGVGRTFMMAVSCMKALLVVLFFMHVKYEADWKYVLTIPASIMSLFLVLALVPDIGYRVDGFFHYKDKSYGYAQERTQNVGTPAETRLIEKASAEGHSGH